MTEELRKAFVRILPGSYWNNYGFEWRSTDGLLVPPQFLRF